MNVGDLVKIKGEPAVCGIVTRVKKESSSAYGSQILEVFVGKKFYTITEKLLEVVNSY